MDVGSFTKLSSIKKQHRNSEGRVSRVVAVIKSCNPNGFGDMTVTLKALFYSFQFDSSNFAALFLVLRV